MKVTRRTILTVVVVIFGLTAGIYLAGTSQTQSTTSKNIFGSKKTILDEEVPITDFDKALPVDPREKEKRQKRSKRSNLELGARTGTYDVNPFILTDERHSGYGGFESHSPLEPGIPVVRSSVIVKGEVMKAESFLTDDKVSIYSEFTIKIDGVLKNVSQQIISRGNLVTISRGGGGVRFGSGKIIKQLFEGKPMPRVGSRYLLFLAYEADGGDYPILTAYELKDGKIFPLDGLDRDGQVIPQLKSHQSFQGASETEFFNLVQFAIDANQNLFKREAE